MFLLKIIYYSFDNFPKGNFRWSDLPTEETARIPDGREKAEDRNLVAPEFEGVCERCGSHCFCVFLAELSYILIY